MEFKKTSWGYWLTFYKIDNCKYKLLFFKKGKSCSLQRHFKRTELWYFIFGTGVFWLNKHSNIVNKHKLLKIQRKSSVLVPTESWHQYSSITPTLVLEKQYGFCEELDIERAG